METYKRLKWVSVFWTIDRALRREIQNCIHYRMLRTLVLLLETEMLYNNNENMSWNVSNNTSFHKFSHKWQKINEWVINMIFCFSGLNAEASATTKTILLILSISLTQTTLSVTPLGWLSYSKYIFSY